MNEFAKHALGWAYAASPVVALIGVAFGGKWWDRRRARASEPKNNRTLHIPNEQENPSMNPSLSTSISDEDVEQRVFDICKSIITAKDAIASTHSIASKSHPGFSVFMGQYSIDLMFDDSMSYGKEVSVKSPDNREKLRDLFVKHVAATKAAREALEKKQRLLKFMSDTESYAASTVDPDRPRSDDALGIPE